ncbi:hypothetical protein PsorP6_016134 [Peronosclerospora sorghi]|uniref:Uncharacterized protein n=1 Tax=Peronosclerospora sorghi TaxID=230839 RepID=A0ACC0VLZ8_9STRA|nr:hypothetical protein PsorP6_016134 [Peronosclerospora sorghi]
MLEQLKAKSTQAASLAMDSAGSLKGAAQKSNLASSLKDVTQKGSATLQAKVGSLNIKVPAVVKASSSSASHADTASESDLERGQSPSNACQENEGLLNELGQECGLTKRQRLYGAISCYVFGALCGFFSTLMLWGGPKHVKQFAFFYTLGSLCSIGSSLFLIGPLRQLKIMCMPVRRVACCIWMGSMCTTLLIAFGFPKAGPLVLFVVIMQYAAMLWYGASFIPYGRAILRKGCSRGASYLTQLEIGMCRGGSFRDMTTPFDRHLRDVYAGRVHDGLSFFEAHGYFDVSETANTVQMFRENVGLQEFWDSFEIRNPLDRATAVYPFGLHRTVPSSRLRRELHRTNSGRFTLLDEDGNPVTEDALLDMEREERLKMKSFELDDQDVAELENELVCLHDAIEVIRVEKRHFQRVFFWACYQEFSNEEVPSTSGARYAPPEIRHIPSPLSLPPHMGNLYVLRDSIARYRRSWSKRWCVLDLQYFTVRLYKRSYWRSFRGDLNLTLATKIKMMGQRGFCIEFGSGNMLLMRSKHEREATRWVQLLRFAMQWAQGNAVRCSEIFRLTNG